nr:hypothetical protein CFP56_01272 [Quercus suber]
MMDVKSAQPIYLRPPPLCSAPTYSGPDWLLPVHDGRATLSCTSYQNAESEMRRSCTYSTPTSCPSWPPTRRIGKALPRHIALVSVSRDSTVLHCLTATVPYLWASSSPDPTFSRQECGGWPGRLIADRSNGRTPMEMIFSSPDVSTDGPFCAPNISATGPATILTLDIPQLDMHLLHLGWVIGSPSRAARLSARHHHAVFAWLRSPHVL